MYLDVSDINQMASGGSYVVIYDADIEVRETGVRVHFQAPPETP